MITLLVALIGIVFLLRQLNIGSDRQLFYALTPFVFFGGALRVIEDANDAIPSADALISYPLNTLVISPIIYFTVFAVTLAAVGLTVWAERRGIVGRYDRLLFITGIGVLTLALGYLISLVVTSAPSVEFYPQVLLSVLTGATLVTGVTWWAIKTLAPSINRGTELIGLVIIWGHAVDGVANVIGLDWMRAIGAGPNQF
jgi:uncharacterized membrane protein